MHNFQIKNCKTDSIETKMTQICIKSAFIKCTGRTLAFHFATGVQMPRTRGNPPPKDVRAWRLRLSGHLARAKTSTDCTCTTLNYVWATEGLEASSCQTNNNVAVDSQIRPPASSEYWSVHWQPVSPRLLYAVCGGNLWRQPRSRPGQGLWDKMTTPQIVTAIVLVSANLGCGRMIAECGQQRQGQNGHSQHPYVS